jgi:hypothetical protein
MNADATEPAMGAAHGCGWIDGCADGLYQCQQCGAYKRSRELGRKISLGCLGSTRVPVDTLSALAYEALCDWAPVEYVRLRWEGVNPLSAWTLAYDLGVTPTAHAWPQQKVRAS